jgi:hypothetical protein
LQDEFEDKPEQYLPAKMDAWPVGLSTDIAYVQGDGAPLYSDDDLCLKYKISLERLGLIREIPAFKLEVDRSRKEIEQCNGTVIKKAALLTEHYIDNLVPEWLTDKNFPPQSKVAVMQFLAKLGRLVDNPVEKAVLEAEAAKKNGSGSNVPHLTIVLNNTPSAPQQPQFIDLNPIPKKD